VQKTPVNENLKKWWRRRDILKINVTVSPLSFI
jgi:hypothetical protein